MLSRYEKIDRAIEDPLCHNKVHLRILSSAFPHFVGRNLTLLVIFLSPSVTDRCVYQGIDGQYRAYAQGEKWRVNQCDYDCQCVDSRTGYYQCKPV